MRKERNNSAKAITQLKNEIGQSGDFKEEKETIISKSKEINRLLQENQKELAQVESSRIETLSMLPCLLSNSVPLGKDESENVEVMSYGNKPKFNFVPKAHKELMENLNLLEINRATKLSGSRFYFLKNEAVLLENAIISFALNFIREKRFNLFATPTLVREEALFGSGFFTVRKG